MQDPPPEVIRARAGNAPAPGPGQPGHPVPEPRPRRHKTVEDGLVHCTAEFRSDLYWGELGLPTDEALKAFRKAEDTEEPVERAAVRKQAFTSLDVGLESMGNIEHKGIFLHEAAVMSISKDTLRLDGSTLASPLAEPGSPEYMQLRRSLLEQEQRELEERQAAAAARREKRLRQQMPFGKPAKAYEWVESADALEMSVTVLVPPLTEKSDVTVKVDKDTLRVSVEGHPREPYVLDGWFPYDVDAAGCTWHLEGDGAEQGARKLVLNIEKDDYADWGPHGLFLQPEEEDTAGSVEATGEENTAPAEADHDAPNFED